MPKGSAVEDVERKLKKEYGSNKHAIYGTLNKIGLMKGNKPTAKGLKKAHTEKRTKKMDRIARKAQSRYV
jgi:hypothetical protein